MGQGWLRKDLDRFQWRVWCNHLLPSQDPKSSLQCSTVVHCRYHNQQRGWHGRAGSHSKLLMSQYHRYSIWKRFSWPEQRLRRVVGSKQPSIGLGFEEQHCSIGRLGQQQDLGCICSSCWYLHMGSDLLVPMVEHWHIWRLSRKVHHRNRDCHILWSNQQVVVQKGTRVVHSFFDEHLRWHQ